MKSTKGLAALALAVAALARGRHRAARDTRLRRQSPRACATAIRRRRKGNSPRLPTSRRRPRTMTRTLPPLPADTVPSGPPPQRFNPTEKVRADFPVSFPIDI